MTHPKEPSGFVEVERVQTGVRLEKRMLKVLKAVAELKDMSLGDLLEGVVLHAFEGKAPFSAETLKEIGMLCDAQCRFAAAFVADHPQRLESSLPLMGNLITIVGPVAAHVKPHRPRDDPGVKLIAAASSQDVRRHNQPMRNHGVLVRVKQCPDDAVPAARIADEQAEAFHVVELIAVFALQPGAVDVLEDSIDGFFRGGENAHDFESNAAAWVVSIYHYLIAAGLAAC